MELFHAHNQWANRPADERFTTLEQMHQVCTAYADRAEESTAPWDALRVDADGDDLYLTRGSGTARIGHYAFGQLAARITPDGARGVESYLRRLPASLAVQNMNWGLKAKVGGNAQMLFHRNSGRLLRAATSETYTRIWNHEVIERLLDVSATHKLVPAAPTFRKTGDDAPALYASDHDMFAFLMTPERAIEGPLGEQLFRGFIVINSEVGAGALKILTFLFREICGNHIIWGAVEVIEVKLIHRSGIRTGWANAQAKVRKYLDGAASIEQARFQQLMVKLGDSKEEVLDKVFGKMRGAITRRALSSGYDAALPDVDGDPRTVYGLAQGITRHSQTIPYADDRTTLDRAAGKLMDLPF